MEPIVVPGPPKSAYNKNRPISDLIRAQVAHFRHLEEKLSPDVRATLPQHQIVTEDDAARYIASFTRYLRTRTPAAHVAAAPTATAQPARSPIVMPQRDDRPLELAASAQPATSPQAKAAPPSSNTQPASAPKKKSSGKSKK